MGFSLSPGGFFRRHQEAELMDLPETSRRDFLQALEDIRWVNRWLSGSKVMVRTFSSLEAVSRAIESPRIPFRVLDLGTGSGDIPVALVQWARTAGLNLSVTALDLHPYAVEAAREYTRDYQEIAVHQGDALNTGFSDGAFDIVISSMFMHHLETVESEKLMKEMARIGRFGFIINDLERHPLAWLGIKLLGALTSKGGVFKNDAPLSVLRGFKRLELEQMIQNAGLAQVRIEHHKPYRWLIIQDKLAI